MKTAIAAGIAVVATIGTIIAIKQIHVLDSVPVLGAGVMKLRTLL